MNHTNELKSILALDYATGQTDKVRFHIAELAKRVGTPIDFLEAYYADIYWGKV